MPGPFRAARVAQPQANRRRNGCQPARAPTPVETGCGQYRRKCPAELRKDRPQLHPQHEWAKASMSAIGTRAGESPKDQKE